MLASVTYVLLTGAILLGLLYFILSNLTRKRRPGEPPIVEGHWLWGNAAAFKEHAVDLLHSSYKKYGDVFTLRLINQHLTIVMDPHSYEAVTKEANFDFDPIQRQVNWNVFNFVLKKPEKMIKEAAKTVRGGNLARSIHGFVDCLDKSYEKVLPPLPPVSLPESKVCKEWHTQGLRTFCVNTMFDALFKTIFGTKEHPVFNSQQVFKNFELFHHYFNFFWLGLPKKMFPSAMKALDELLCQPTSQDLLERDDLCDYLRTAVNYMQEQGQTEEDMKGHNLVFLHVNYNTFRLAFWVLDLLLEHPKAMAALLDEIEVAVKTKEEEFGKALFTQKDVESMTILESVVQESARMSSGVFIVRYVNQDTTFKTDRGEEHLIRGGDRVAIYPPAFHKDPEIFEDPEEFKYNRFVDAKFYKRGKEVKHPVIAFGALCPGKRYAILQLKWYIISVLSQFHLELDSGTHAEMDNGYYGHEILPPKSDIDVRIRRRDSPLDLHFTSSS